MSAVVLLTFDFDAESTALQPDVAAHARDLTLLSLGAFGGRRGIARILALLDEVGVAATFFVPGWTVEAYPKRVREIVERGHEVGHHGFNHVPPVALSEAGQREDFLRGVEAIERCTEQRPRGYRSPSWQLTPYTLALLDEFDFAYDSSCMGDDRPYLERHDDLEILELPVHWTLDDFPHIGWTLESRGPLRDAGEMIASFRREVDAAIRENRPLVITAHPELVGRAGPMEVFSDFVHQLNNDPRIEFSRCVDLADAWAER